MYVAVKGGEKAIDKSLELLAEERRGDASVPENRSKGINPKSPQNICLHPGFDTFLKYSPRSPPGPLHEPEIADNPNYSPNQPISGPTNKTNAHV